VVGLVTLILDTIFLIFFLLHFLIFLLGCVLVLLLLLPFPTRRSSDLLLFQLRELLSICDQGDLGYELAAKQQLYAMLHTILPQGRHVNRSKGLNNETKLLRLKKAITYIQLHYHQPLKIAEIAGQIPMSEGQFIRFFKSMTRQTPIEYLNSYRIRRAAELLLDPSNKISSVAMDVGFD